MGSFRWVSNMIILSPNLKLCFKLSREHLPNGCLKGNIRSEIWHCQTTLGQSCIQGVPFRKMGSCGPLAAGIVLHRVHCCGPWVSLSHGIIPWFMQPVMAGQIGSCLLILKSYLLRIQLPNTLTGGGSPHHACRWLQPAQLLSSHNKVPIEGIIGAGNND